MWIRLISKDTDSSVQLHDPRGPHAIPHEIPWDSRSPSVALQPQWLRDPWAPENPKTLSSRRAIYLILSYLIIFYLLLGVPRCRQVTFVGRLLRSARTIISSRLNSPPFLGPGADISQPGSVPICDLRGELTSHLYDVGLAEDQLVENSSALQK